MALPFVHCFFQRVFQLLDVYGFGQIVQDTETDRAFRVVKTFMSCQHDDDGREILGVDPFNEFDAVLLRELDIRKDDVDVRIFFNDIPRLPGVISRQAGLYADAVPRGIFQYLFNYIVFIIYDQYFHSFLLYVAGRSYNI